MIGYDTSETTSIFLLDTQWTIGLLPLGKYDELADAVEDASKPFAHHTRMHTRPDGSVDLAATEHCETCSSLWSELTRRLRPVYRELVRWGLRDCEAPAIDVVMEPERLAGREYEVAARTVVERLSRIANGTLVQRLATAILEANRLSAREVLGFK